MSSKGELAAAKRSRVLGAATISGLRKFLNIFKFKINEIEINYFGLYLSSEKMEVLRRSGGVHDVEIDIVSVWLHFARVGKLQKSLQATRAVFRTGSIIAMGEQHHNSTACDPLGY